jgi:hypothetical protein
MLKSSCHAGALCALFGLSMGSLGIASDFGLGSRLSVCLGLLDVGVCSPPGVSPLGGVLGPLVGLAVVSGSAGHLPILTGIQCGMSTRPSGKWTCLGLIGCCLPLFRGADTGVLPSGIGVRWISSGMRASAGSLGAGHGGIIGSCLTGAGFMNGMNLHRNFLLHGVMHLEPSTLMVY